MANERELSLKITGDSSQAERAVARLEQALAKAEKELAKAKETTDKLDDKVDDLGGKSDSTAGRLDVLGGKVGGVARDHLGPLGDVADKVGLDLDNMSAGGLAAGAAIAGMATFVAGGVEKLGAMHDEIRQFRNTAGTSWEDSSRLVSVMDDLGIAADTGAVSMGRLAKNIDAGKLAEFGIEVARAKDGTVDMTATLGNVADKMNATVDPTKRAAMGTAIFGKSWADLAPLLQQGSAGIEDAMGNVKAYQIATAESDRQQREMAMAVDDLQDAVAGLQMALARDLIPQLTELATNGAKVVDFANSANEKFGAFTKTVDYATNPLKFFRGALGDVWGQFSEGEAKGNTLAKTLVEVALQSGSAAHAEMALAAAADGAGESAQILEARQKDAAVAAKELADRARDQRTELDKLNGVVLTAAGSTLSYERAVMANRDAQVAVAEKQREATEAVAEFGEDAPEAVAAQQDYEKAVLDAKNAALGQADAAVAQAEKLALASGQTFTAEQKNIVFKESLEKVRDATNDSNLRAGLDGLIQLTGDAATTANDAAREYLAAEAAASRLAAIAAGVNTTGAGEIIGTADSAERRLANQRGGGSNLSAAPAPPAPSVVNVQVTSYGTNARDLEGLVTEQLIQQRMERGG